jgi:hypothetical protein
MNTAVRASLAGEMGIAGQLVAVWTQGVGMTQYAVAASILGAVCLSGSAVAEPVVPAPGSIRVESLAYQGDGCPAGSAAVDIAHYGNAFTVIFSEFIVQQGPDVARAEAEKGCNVTVALTVPPGLTYAVTSVDYRGYASIAPGAVGYHRGMYHFQGGPPLRSAWTPFAGARDEDWHVREVADTVVWGKCRTERKLQLKAHLRLERGRSAATDSSFMTIDSQDGEIRQTYHLAWSSCTSRR